MTLSRHFCLFLAGFCLAVFGACQAACADTIRLKGGRTIQGQIIREDTTQVAIIVSGTVEAYPKSAVEQLSYAHRRLVLPTTPSSSSFKASPETAVDLTLIEQLQKRLQAFNRFTDRAGRIFEAVRYRKGGEALSEVQEAARETLPLHRDRFSPLSALADILILLGFRVPALWLALFVVKEPRQFTRIAEFLIPAYGLIMLLMAYAWMTTHFIVALVMFPAAIVVIMLLFTWMFALTPSRALLAFLIAVGSNVLIEYLLVQARLI